MDFALTSEQQMLVQTVRKFVYRELVPLEDEIERTGQLSPELARSVFEKSMRLGFYATNVPEEYGGGGLSALETMLLEEQFGHTKDILIRRAFGNVYEVLFVGTDEQKQRWLLPCVQGERTCSIAITEPGAGSDAAGISTRAVPTGEGWTLTGHKHFVSDGMFSDFFIVSAVTDPAARPRHISLFLVDKDTPGVTIGKDQKMMGLTGTSHVEIFFDDVALGPENLLGGEGNGLRLVLTTLGRVRLGQVGARALGKACRLLTLAVEYSAQREQFGRPIGDFQMVQAMLADSAIEIQRSRLLLWRAAWALDIGDEKAARTLISMVKVDAAETLGRVADRTVQIFGGSGYAKESVVERLYRDARIFRIFDGTSEIHRTVVAGGLRRVGPQVYDVGA